MKWSRVIMKDLDGLGTRHRHKNTAGRSVVFVLLCVCVCACVSLSIIYLFVYLLSRSGDRSPGRWASGDERQRQAGEHWGKSAAGRK